LEIVVPAHNEARRLPEGLARLCRKAATLPLPTAIVVVDSTSTDGTGDVVRRWPRHQVPVRLLRCERPGKGIAVRAGLLATRAPFAGFCDADMATELSALDVAISLLAAGNPMVIGSRAHDDSVVEARSSAARRVGAAAFRDVAAIWLRSRFEQERAQHEAAEREPAAAVPQALPAAGPQVLPVGVGTT